VPAGVAYSPAQPPRIEERARLRATRWACADVAVLEWLPNAAVKAALEAVTGSESVWVAW
jgi:hypothetical protein